MFFRMHTSPIPDPLADPTRDPDADDDGHAAGEPVMPSEDDDDK